MKKLSITATVILFQCLASTSIKAQPIGTVASTDPTLQGTAPGQTTRRLNIGARVVSNETISSSSKGRGQILFADQSTLTIGPNTTIILDQFIFDPTSNNNNFGMQLARGTLRFIGGAVSDQVPATVETPTATIGIRGSTAFVNYLNGETTAIFVAGEEMCLTSRASGQQTCTSRQGGILNETGYQGTATAGIFARILESIDGIPGQMQRGDGIASTINNLNLLNRGPVSTSGKDFETELFEENNITRELLENDSTDRRIRQFIEEAPQG